MFFVGMMTFFLISYTFHCTWVTSEAYSSPSIVLSARSHDGSRIIFDDFREAYWWLRMNTPEDAKVRESSLMSSCGSGASVSERCGSGVKISRFLMPHRFQKVRFLLMMEKNVKMFILTFLQRDSY
jgi:hypothetical protein